MMEHTISAYQRAWRRTLSDLEIPGWDERFMSEFDPEHMADLWASSKATGVMFSCKNLSGLCYWPTKVGPVHPGIGDRDIVGELVAALERRGLAPCAYYSSVYDNWAFEHDPDWRFMPVQGWVRNPHDPAGDRHSVCCLNSPGYRDYIAAQIADLYGRYRFEITYVDMTFWHGVCCCRHCRERFGAELPERVDWTAPDWCGFQRAREEWVVDYTGFVTDAIKRASPGISVYHNFGPVMKGWWRGQPATVSKHQDTLGGDFYGDEIQQLIITKLMNNLAPSGPVEFETFTTASSREHVELRPPEQMRGKVLAAAAESAAFMYIEAVDPVGTANAGGYLHAADAFEAMVPFEPFLGGEAIEDVAIYFSSESKFSFETNGTLLTDLRSSSQRGSEDFPHMSAIRGACRALRRAHIPFGIISRHLLGELDRYRAIILPNVAHMDAEEVAAFRAYVERGGRLYASRYTSLVDSRDGLQDDFRLADVFGVRLRHEEPSDWVYAKPATDEMRAFLGHQRYLTVRPGPDSIAGGLLRLAADADTEVLATLSLPYAHPEPGHWSDDKWASMHTSPPWEDTDEPVIVRHRFGAGRAVYCAYDFETRESRAAQRMFAGLIAELLDGEASVASDVDPSVAISAFHGPRPDTIRVCLLNHPPLVTRPASLRVRVPEGKRFVALTDVPSGEDVAFTTHDDGTLECQLGQLPELTMLLARYEESQGRERGDGESA
jgi:hypothetical protein